MVDNETDSEEEGMVGAEDQVVPTERSLLGSPDANSDVTDFEDVISSDIESESELVTSPSPGNTSVSAQSKFETPPPKIRTSTSQHSSAVSADERTICSSPRVTEAGPLCGMGEWNDIPRFAVLTGQNGSGKSEYLESLSKKYSERASYLEANQQTLKGAPQGKTAVSNNPQITKILCNLHENESAIKTYNKMLVEEYGLGYLEIGTVTKSTVTLKDKRTLESLSSGEQSILLILAERLRVRLLISTTI